GRDPFAGLDHHPVGAAHLAVGEHLADVRGGRVLGLHRFPSSTARPVVRVVIMLTTRSRRAPRSGSDRLSLTTCIGGRVGPRPSSMAHACLGERVRTPFWPEVSPALRAPMASPYTSWRRCRTYWRCLAVERVSLMCATMS